MNDHVKQSGGLGVPSSNLGAPTTNPIEDQTKFPAANSARERENRTERRQGAQQRTESPEEVPNHVRQPFPGPRLIVAEFPRNDRETIRIALDEYRGLNTVDVRVWWRDGNELKPGKSGITTSVKNLPALAAALTLALAKAREMRLVD